MSFTIFRISRWAKCFNDPPESAEQAKRNAEIVQARLQALYPEVTIHISDQPSSGDKRIIDALDYVLDQNYKQWTAGENEPDPKITESKRRVEVQELGQVLPDPFKSD